MTSTRRPVRIVHLVCMMIAAAAATRAHAQKLSYEMTIDSEVRVKLPGRSKPQDMTALSKIDYTVETQGGILSVSISAIGHTVTREGKLLLDRYMNRTELVTRQGDHPAARVAFDETSADTQRILREFDTPLARFSVDPDGVETGRELLVDPDAELVEAGLLDTVRLFHAPFRASADSWTAPARITMIGEHSARGDLTYTKLGTEPNGTMKVKVAGELAADPRGSESPIKRGVYKVEGEQFYDPARRAWISGRLVVDVSLEVSAEGHAVGTAVGTMRIALNLQDAREETPE